MEKIVLSKIGFVVAVVIFLVPTGGEAAAVYEQADSSVVVGNGTINGFSAVKFGGDTPSFDAPFGLSQVRMFGQASSTDATVTIYVTCRTVNGSNWGVSFCGDEWAGGVNHYIVVNQPMSDTLGVQVFSTATTVPFRSVASNNPNVNYYYYFALQVSSGANIYGRVPPHLCVIGCGEGIDITGDPYLILNEAEQSINPVIIIPGILGSEKNSDGEWVIDPILHTYDDLIATLDVNHYTPDVDLFTFPYDWRKSNVDTAVLLKQKIDEVKIICGCDKVDLVAHSMGGLVARQYIQSPEYDQDVDQLIFLGTPHLGAPKAYLMWEGGDIGPFEISQPLNSVWDILTERLLAHEAREKGYADLFDYIRHEPILSVQQLLPIHDYIFDGILLRNYPSNYPRNLFLENLNEDLSDLLTLNTEIHNIIGETETSTTISGVDAIDPSSYLPKWEHGYPDGFNLPFGDHGLILSSGDQTVPLASASFVNENLQTKPYTHGTLPSLTEGDVYKILTKEDASTLIHENTGANLRLLLIKILSPADLFVTDPDGHKIGKTNGQIVNEISGAFYTGFNTNTEYITILNPLDGEYKVTTEGTGIGAYTVEATYISQATTTEASFTGNTTVGLFTELVVPINNQSPEEIEVQSTDADPPIVTITQPEARDYLRSEQMPVNVSASDVSGVFALETTFGTTTIPNIGTLDLFFQKLGPKILTASSTDNVSNATTSTRTFRVIATASSTISDIDRAYSLGWMTTTVYQTISKKFKAAIKFSKITERWADGRPKGTKIQAVVDKILMAAMLVEIQRYRGKGLNEQGHQLLREDILWLISN